MMPVFDVVRMLATILPALADLLEHLVVHGEGNAALERQLMLQLERAASDERARREIAGP